jgi:hypothetical protein
MVTGATNSWLFMNLFLISFTAELSSAKLKWLSRNPIINPTGTGNTFDFSCKCPEMINDSKNRFNISVQSTHTEQLLAALYIMRTAWIQYLGIKPHFMEVKFKIWRFEQNSYSLLFWCIHLQIYTLVFVSATEQTSSIQSKEIRPIWLATTCVETSV